VSIYLTEEATPGTPSAGKVVLYAKTDGLLYWRTDDGTEHSLAAPLIPQNSQSANYTLVIGDASKHILHPSSDNNARTFTIPANASVAFDIGTAVTFVNKINTITIAITSDTLTLAGPGTTGSRTLAANGQATALKIGTTEWMIDGVGLT
jgi:hypothetical protein